MQVPRRSAWATVAVVVYMASLVLPVSGVGWHECVPGIYCLLIGWLVPVPWSANVFLLIAGLSRPSKPRWALLCALVAMFAGLTAHRMVPELGVGFYVWMASMVAMVIACARSVVESDAPIAWARVRTWRRRDQNLIVR